MHLTGANILVPIALFGWPIVTFVLFLRLGGFWGTLLSYMGAWMFLPPSFSFALPGLPDYGRITACSLACLACTALFESRRLMLLRPTIGDIPMAVWLIAPFFASVSNDLGAYDGASAAWQQGVTWGIPYLMGRLYFGSLASLRALAVSVVISGLVYMPLCLLEMRIAPVLNVTVYGFAQHKFVQTIRFGGYRPMVFMPHGLVVSLWMASASMLGLWMWRRGALKSIRGHPAIWFLAPLTVTFILCKSVGAVVLFLLGTAALAVTRRTRTVICVLAIAAIPPTYMVVRAGGMWSGEGAVELASALVGSDRADSLKGRMFMENILIERAMERPILGWGGWGRNRVRDETGKDISTVDGMWVLAIGTSGIVGLTAFYTLALLPSMLVLHRVPARLWGSAALAPLTGLCVLLLLYSIDALLNAVVCPLMMLAQGGIITLWAAGPAAIYGINPGRARAAPGTTPGTNPGAGPPRAPALAAPAPAQAALSWKRTER